MASIIQNTSALFLANLVSRFFSFGLIILLPRYFGTHELGEYFFAAFFTNMMAIFTELGMHMPLIREITIAPKRAQTFMTNALAIQALLSVCTFGAMAGIVNVLGYSAQTVWMVYILGLSEIANSLAQLFRCVFRAFEQMKYEAVVIIIWRILTFVVGGGLVIAHSHITTFCLVVLFASGINMALSLGIMLIKFTKLSFNLDLRIWKRLLAQALPFALGNVSSLIYIRISVVFLSKLSPNYEFLFPYEHLPREVRTFATREVRKIGKAAVTWYSLAHGLVSAFAIIPGAFMGSIFPVMSRVFLRIERRRNPDTDEDAEFDFQKLYTQSLKLMFITALPLVLCLIFLSNEIVSVLWPRDSYPPWTIDAALVPLSWALGLSFINRVYRTVLRAADKRIAFTILIGTGTVMNILLNLYLIPRFSHKGAAIAMAFTEIYLLLGGFAYVHTRLAKPHKIRFIFTSLLGSLCLMGELLLLRRHLPVYLLIPLAVLTYGGLMIWWRELNWEDFRI